MNTVATKTLYTPEDLLTMPDGDRYELVDGQLVEHTMSFLSSYVAGEIYARVRDFSRAHRPGWALPEGTTYQCFPHAPGKVRKADVSFIRAERYTAEQALQEGHVLIHPDLCVEVVSPNDSYYDVDQKAEEYLRAGVSLVWIANPVNRTVQVRRADGTSTTLREHDELTGEKVLPGFRCRVGDLFQLPPGVTPPSRSGPET